MIYVFLLVAVSIVAFLLGGFMFLTSTTKTGRKRTIGMFVAGIAVLFFIFVPWNFHQVNTGEVAVVRHLGKIEKTRTAGIYWDFYLTNKYEKYDTKVQQVSVNTSAYSSDGQTLNLQVIIQYQIKQEEADKIATIYGNLATLESRIETIAIERVKSVVSEKTAMNIIATRNVVSQDVTVRIEEAVGDDYYVRINSVVLTDVEFTKEFEKIVEDKVAAEQEAQKAINEAAKKKTEAESAKEVAQLAADAELYKAQKEAEAILIKAQAEADALLLEKGASADAIQVYVDSLGLSAADAVKLYEYIIWVQAWDGKVPMVTDPDSGYIVVPGN